MKKKIDRHAFKAARLRAVQDLLEDSSVWFPTSSELKQLARQLNAHGRKLPAPSRSITVGHLVGFDEAGTKLHQNKFGTFYYTTKK